MLGIFHGPLGRDQASIKSPAREPKVEEIIPTPPSESAEFNEVSKPALLSPSPGTGNLKVQKRQSSFNRAVGTIRESFGRLTNSYVREQHLIYRQRAERELGSSVGRHAYDTSIEGLLRWIKNERMVRIPSKGGSWDKVLIGAQYFAEQVHHLNKHISTFTEEAESAANLVFGQCMILLELGHENAEALEKAFELFYQFGLELSPLLAQGEIFGETQAIMDGIGKAFADLLQIVTGVSITFYQAVHSNHKVTKLDIFATFSSSIENFRHRVRRCSHEMWKYVLGRYHQDSCNIEEIQDWLKPKDSVLAFLASDHIKLAPVRNEFTCGWFQTHLSSFLKGSKDILLVEGKAGTGKSVLAGWVVDRLRRPIGRKHVSTISFSYDQSIVGQSTTNAMLKTLLNQLLSQRIGDIDLFNAINETFLEASSLRTAADLETKLWKSLSKALHSVNQHSDETLTIVLDGLIDNHNMKQACKKLHDLAHKNPIIKVIQFSQPFAEKVDSSTHVHLNADMLSDDIRTIVRQEIAGHDQIRNREIGEQESIIEQIVEASQGNILWAYLTCKKIRRQTTKSELDNTVKNSCAGSKDPVDTARSLIKVTSLDNFHRELLVLLCTVARPMQIGEIDALCRVNDRTEMKTDILSLISRVSAFTVSNEGLVAIRHESIRKAIIESKDDAALSHSIKNAQYDMTVRLLSHIKSKLHDEFEPTFTGMERRQAESKLRTHRLLEYAVRYWAYHFKKSSHYKPKGELEVTDELRRVLPPSVSLCLLEQSCWNSQEYSHDALAFHELAYRLRKTVFTDVKDQRCLLQSAISCALVCESMQVERIECVDWYGLAAKLSKITVGVQANLTITCCQTLLRVSETLVTRHYNTVMKHREEVLIILVETHTYRYGRASKEVLEIYKRLQELYLYVEDEVNLKKTITIIQEITVSIYGGHSLEAEKISRSASVMLKKHQHITEIEVNKDSTFLDYRLDVHTHEELTIIHVEEMLKLALVWISKRHFEKAEEIYVELWLRLTEHCINRHVCEWHEIKIKVMVEYAEFLMEQKRISEASAIFVAVWSEYENHEFSMFEAVILMLKKVAISLKTLGLLTLSLSIFRKCWSFYKHHHHESHTILIEIEEHISIVSTEISKKTTETTTTTTSETIIREVFESSMSSETTVITTKTVDLCRSLTSLYMKDCRWHEAVTCIKRLLIKSWSTFFAESIDLILLAEHHRSECVILVLQLAECYLRQKRCEKAEFVYMRLYRAYRKCFGIDHAEVVKYRKTLIEFYERHELFVKQISFYQELLIDYREHKSYSLMVDLLYKLGAICRMHSTNYGYWLEYYLEIIVHLNKGREVCHPDAFEALLVVTRHYYETLRFSESLMYFRSIFATFFKHGVSWQFFKDYKQVRVLIEHYFRAIDESKLDFKLHVEIIKQLRESCHRYYGAHHELTIIVTETLAEVCERHEEYRHEAIHFLELIVMHQSTVSVEIVKRVEKRLHTLYFEQITKKKTVITKEMIEKATKLVYARYKLIIAEHECCAHQTALTVLQELVMLYIEAKQSELAVQELKLAIISIIMKKSVSARKMIEAASFLATIYISCGWKEHAITIIRELKLQIIYKHTGGCSKHGFDVTKVGRECFAFIAAFEYHVRSIRSVSIAMYMADLIAEYTFYERLIKHLKVKNALLQVFICSSRIRQVTTRTHRVEDFTLVENKVISYFTEHESSVVKRSTKASIKSFVVLLLEYFSNNGVSDKNWTALAGHAAVSRLEILLKNKRHQEALELTKCTFEFLMAHEGLDDPSEITLGFKLCLMMAGRNNGYPQPSDANIQRAMMDLSRQILEEIIKICKNPIYKISIVRCPLNELNQLIELLGEQKSWNNLQWLLELLWGSREGQKTWDQDANLRLGRRLAEVRFIQGSINDAISLCENIVYNVRRVRGVRHQYTLELHELLASMYISRAIVYREAALKDSSDNKKYAEMMAKTYFKKAVQVHEDMLKLIVSADDIDDSDCDEDESEAIDILSQFGSVQTNFQSGFCWSSKQHEIDHVSRHVRQLLLAIQRYGGFPKARSDYEKLMQKVYHTYKNEPSFKLSENQVLASKWKIDGHGNGQAEGGSEEDVFQEPKHWYITKLEL